MERGGDRDVLTGTLRHLPAILLVGLLALYLSLDWNVGVVLYDEGVFVYPGWRVASGEIPYADFWSIYAPGQFLLLAGLFLAFGLKLVVVRIFERALFLVCGLLAVFVGFKLTQRRWVGLIAGALIVLWLGTGPALFSFNGTALPTGIFFVFLTWTAVVSSPSHIHRRHAFVWGLSAGTGMLFRQDLVAYLLIPTLLFLAWRTKVGGRAIKQRLGLILVCVAAASLPWGLAGLWLAPHVEISEVFKSTVLFPVITNPEIRELPMDPVLPKFSEGISPLAALDQWSRHGLVYLLPLVVIALGLPLLVKELTAARRGQGFQPSSNFLLIWLSSAAFLDYGRIRSDIYHFYPALVLSLVILPIVITVWVRRLSLLRVIGYAALALTIIAGFVPVRAKFAFRSQSPALAPLRSGPGKGIRISEDQRQEIEGTLTFLTNVTSPDEPIFVSGPRNDRVIASASLFYVLVARSAATGHYELSPGHSTLASVQRQIISDLERRSVRYVVVYPNFDLGCAEPNLSCKEEARLLDVYLRKTFAPVFTSGTISVLGRIVEQFEDNGRQ